MSERPVPPPFPVARDAETLPGVDSQQDAMALRRENLRLRQQRNQLQLQVDAARTSDAPPPTRKQKLVRRAMSSGHYALLVALVAAVAPAVAKKWPAYADLIDGVLSGLGLK